ncbi:hypothetical protein QLX08_000419 [Tetragonisca angustula]|uniref:Uncharacterized protein n=1 Tax=Tetragonisca angustula TaxID=166442 RepID=A0AAW1AJL5_9HYME
MTTVHSLFDGETVGIDGETPCSSLSFESANSRHLGKSIALDKPGLEYRKRSPYSREFYYKNTSFEDRRNTSMVEPCE